MKKMMIVVVMVVGLVMGGCMLHQSINEGARMTIDQYNKIINAEKEKLIQIGMTKEDVKSLIGEPQIIYKVRDYGYGALYPSSSIHSLGDETWEYTSRNPNLKGIPFAVSHPLWIWFKNDKVTKVGRERIL